MLGCGFIYILLSLVNVYNSIAILKQNSIELAKVLWTSFEAGSYLGSARSVDPDLGSENFDSRI